MTKRITTLLLTLLALTSCIKNDLPKPTVDLFVESISVKGVSGECIIDRANKTVTIPLLPETNIEAVEIENITFGSDVVTNIAYDVNMENLEVSRTLIGSHNLEKPLDFTLSYFQTYEWHIVAEQTIPRDFAVAGQIGAAEWDIEHQLVKVKRDDQLSIKEVETKIIDFGPRPTYSYPTVEEMNSKYNDFSGDNLERDGGWDAENGWYFRTIAVAAHGKSVMWKIAIIPTKVSVNFVYMAGGANVAWIAAQSVGDKTISFRYRKKGAEEWIAVPENWYATAENSNAYNSYDEGLVKIVLRGLETNTEYEIIGTADGVDSDIRTVTTGGTYQMPNSDMEQWSQYSNMRHELLAGKAGKCWYPFSSIDNMYWGSGNPGSTSLGEKYNLTYPSTNIPAGSKGTKSVYMASQYVLVKFAAGNLFVGYYGETKGTNAYVYFGQPYNENARPVAIRFSIKYNVGTIDKVSKDSPVSVGEPDIAKIFFCLTNWDKPHCVYSADTSTFFDPQKADGILGLSYFDTYQNKDEMVENTQEWHTMTLPVEYNDFESFNTPSYLVLTFTCSGYGDYFAGSTQSWMYVDDIELLYDLDENNQPK